MKKNYIEAVDKAVSLAKDNKSIYIKIATDIVETIFNTISEKSQKIVGINNRIKTEQSLKEKLIRKKIYKLSNKPDEMLGYIWDIIGILIECEFVKDEENVYESVMSGFTKVDNSWAQSKLNDKIFLNIEEPQPQILKNNTPTYKIDGLYKTKNKSYKFELQIKSMVKVFWSEVEHSIVYKNNYYMPDDMYVVNTLNAIKSNLFGLDNMLNLINSHTSTINSVSLLSNLTLNEKLIKQLVSETFNDKIMKKIRIKINIKNTRDLACKFIMYEHNKLTQEEQNQHFYYLIERFKKLQAEDGTLDNIPESLEFNNCNYGPSKKCLYQIIPQDFEWDLYFNILKSIYPDKSLEYFITGTIKLLITLLNIQDLGIKLQNKMLCELIKQGVPTIDI